MRRIALASLVGLVACQGTGTQAPTTMPASVREAGQHASLEYEVNGRSIPMPFVRGSIGTHETIFMIDTGSNANVLSSWFAEECGLPVTRAPQTSSREAPMLLVDHPLISIDGLGDIDVSSMIVVEVPAVYEEMGVGGILSPQMLVSESAAVILDLQRDTLSRVPRTRVLDLEGVEGEFMTRTPIGLCEEHERGMVFRTLLVRASVGGEDAQLVVTDGMARTSLPSRMTTVGQHVDINVGFVHRSIEAAVVDDASVGRCAHDGLLGRDFLANCVLVFDGDRAAARCAD